MADGESLIDDECSLMDDHCPQKTIRLGSALRRRRGIIIIMCLIAAKLIPATAPFENAQPAKI